MLKTLWMLGMVLFLAVSVPAGAETSEAEFDGLSGFGVQQAGQDTVYIYSDSTCPACIALSQAIAQGRVQFRGARVIYRPGAEAPAVPPNGVLAPTTVIRVDNQPFGEPIVGCQVEAINTQIRLATR